MGAGAASIELIVGGRSRYRGHGRLAERNTKFNISLRRGCRVRADGPGPPRCREAEAPPMAKIGSAPSASSRRTTPRDRLSVGRPAAILTHHHAQQLICLMYHPAQTYRFRTSLPLCDVLELFMHQKGRAPARRIGLGSRAIFPLRQACSADTGKARAGSHGHSPHRIDSRRGQQVDAATQGDVT